MRTVNAEITASDRGESIMGTALWVAVVPGRDGVMKRLVCMVYPSRGEGLYPVLEEFAGLRPHS